MQFPDAPASSHRLSCDLLELRQLLPHPRSFTNPKRASPGAVLPATSPPPPRPRKGTSANKTETKRWVRPTYLGAAGATRRCPARHYHLGLEPHLRGRGCGDKRSGSASPVPPRPGVRRHEAARGEERERRGSTALVVGKPGKFPNPPILPPRAAPAAATLHQLSGATLAQSGTSRTQTGHPALTGRRPQQQRQGDAAEQPPALHGSRQGPLSAAAL